MEGNRGAKQENKKTRCHLFKDDTLFFTFTRIDGRRGTIYLNYANSDTTFLSAAKASSGSLS